MSLPEKPKHSGLIFRVAVPSPLRRIFDYLPPKDLVGEPEAGVRVLIPFGRRKVVGMLLECAQGSSFDAGKLKHVLEILDDTPLYSPALFKTLLWSANYYQHPLGEVFATALPAKLRAGASLIAETEIWKPAKAIGDHEMDSLGRAVKQKALLQFIVGSGEVGREEIAAEGFSQQILGQLIQKGLVQKTSKAVPELEAFKPTGDTRQESLTLNEEQEKAVALISKNAASYNCFLLDGVTGSGKTEVYMQVIEQQLAQGKQCLILIPEIGLTPQTVSRFESRFSCPVVSLHSGLTDSERLLAWNRARTGNASLIIGTRSAIFTPLAMPGLIVIDEEHDSSFKQQDGFRYSARDLAVMRGREENIPVILGSATPSLESLHNARTSKFHYLQLGSRAGAAQTSTMKILDVSQMTMDNGFSEQLLTKIEKHIKEGNQVLVFINRRGFAPILSCQHCGWIGECDNCVAQLTVHAKPPGLRCHHCGTIRPLPKTCPSCSSGALNSIGIGTQKIEEYLAARFKQIPVLRIDRDSIRSKFRFENMLAQIHEGKPCILIGTQMLAKGHHFPNITLVAVLDSDAGLFSADFRGQEHMAQTIVQVAGRAGRADRPGEVIVQSRHATHISLQTLSKKDYSEFASLMLAERELGEMPPYSHLALFRAEAAQLNQAVDFLMQVSSLADRLFQELDLAVEKLGPLPAPMEKRAGRYRVQLLLKSQSRGMMQKAISQLCTEIESIKQPNRLRWSVDVDPQDLI